MGDDPADLFPEDSPKKPYDPTDPAGDPFGPPKISILVHCLHCDEEYDSYRIDWRIETDPDGEKHGFWCCPIEGCDGRGFGFDIWPTDPDWTDEDGNRVIFFDDEDDEEDEEFDDEISDVKKESRDLPEDDIPF